MRVQRLRPYSSRWTSRGQSELEEFVQVVQSIRMLYYRHRHRWRPSGLYNMVQQTGIEHDPCIRRPSSSSCWRRVDTRGLAMCEGDHFGSAESSSGACSEPDASASPLYTDASTAVSISAYQHKHRASHRRSRDEVRR